MHTVTWKGNDESPVCEEDGCSRTFSLMNRRHHCRRCGGLFCSGCSSRKITVPRLGPGRHRVCNRCYVKHKANSEMPGEKDTFFALQASRLVCSPEELIEAGFRILHFQPYGKRNTQWCVVTHMSRPGCCFVSFSSSKPVLECLSENHSLDIESINGARVHSGVYTALQSELKTVMAVISQQIPGGWKVVFTGFSLGGAMGVVSMLEVKSAGLKHGDVEAITFGAPSVVHKNDEKGKSGAALPRGVDNPRVTNFVLNFDIVPRLMSLSRANLTAFTTQAPTTPDPLSTGLPKYLSNTKTSPLHTTYTPLGTHVFLQLITDLPTTPYRLSAGIVEPIPSEAPENTVARDLLNYMPGFTGVLNGSRYPDFFVKDCLEVHDMRMYFPAVRHLCKTGWGCMPVGGESSTKGVPKSPRREVGSFYNTSRRAVMVGGGGREEEVRGGKHASVGEWGEWRLGVEGGSVSTCLVNMESVDQVVETDVGLRMLQHIIDKTAPPVMELLEGDPSLSPCIVDTTTTYPVAVCITSSQLLVIPHNPSRPTISHPVSTIDVVTTPVQTEMEWPAGIGFPGGLILLRIAGEYVKIGFRIPENAMHFYKSLKSQSTFDPEDPEIISFIADSGPPSRVSTQHSTASTIPETEASMPTISPSEDAPCSWVFHVSPSLGSVLLSQSPEQAYTSVVYDEEDNIQHCQSNATLDRWLGLHMFSRKLALMEDTPVWRVEMPDVAYPPRCESLGK
eukprot:TRINITY_DN8149_c0_g1_i2.p1 TRINITY_DN8149_c0_g1~~TRINITY_DN8149_c0_g1_i2.p1  ORF type:complete len:733 (+),score=50.08 TRINITY_DN8149_c0_g1_i2:431-2629(+)